MENKAQIQYNIMYKKKNGSKTKLDKNANEN